jgi:hypothetical protein
MSPEQVAQGTVDRRSDVFALGIVLYELTTGKRLFKGANEVETLRLVLDTKVPKPSEWIPAYPPELERIVMRALERSPDRRYQSARDLQFDLEGFARDQKLQISSAALAEWMEGTFGPKREVWHDLPAASAEANVDTPARPGEDTAATRKVAHAELADLPVIVNARSQSRSRRTTLIVAATLLLVPLIGGAALALRGGAGGGAAPRSGAGGAAVFVVAENGNVAIEGNAPPPVAAPASDIAAVPPSPVAATPQPTAPPEPPAKPRASRAGRSHRTAGPDGLSSAVAKQSADIRRCFAELEVDDAGLGEIALRFEVGVDGAIKSLAVLPPAVGSSPLGTCLAAAGRKTRFEPQAKPITFRIPLTIHLRHQGH